MTALGLSTFGVLGGIYGYAFGSKEGIEKFWDHNEWFRCLTYVVVSAAIIAACVMLAPETVVIAGVSFGSGSTFVLNCALVGAIMGFIYGGTNGFSGNSWNWERAIKCMSYGAAIGASVGQGFANLNSVWSATTSARAGIIECGTGYTATAMPNLTNFIAASAYAGENVQTAAWMICASQALSIVTTSMGVDSLMSGHCTFIPALDINLSNGDTSVNGYEAFGGLFASPIGLGFYFGPQ